MPPQDVGNFMMASFGSLNPTIMKPIKTILAAVAVALTAIFPSIVGAQTIRERELLQQQRIANGITNGTLSPAETIKLEEREVALRETIKSDRAENDGTLTPDDRQAIQEKQDRISRQIAAAKHDSIRERLERQQDRIGDGVTNGTLTPSETIKLEEKEMAVRKQIRADRAENNGKLTSDDRQKIQQRLDRISHRIAAAKHDGQGK